MRRTDLSVNLLLSATSIFAVFLLAEGAYRVRLLQSGAFQRKYQVAANVFGEYDHDFGVRYAASRSFTLFNVINGKVTWCPETLFVTNKDGLAGRTTFADLGHRELKIAVFGDSFTQWAYGGDTWPDLLALRLEEATGSSVGVLNYGTGGYGVLQMFDLAAAVVRDHEPDLVIFALITDDLTRPRWWAQTVVADGITHPLTFADPDTTDPKRGREGYLVHPDADLAWCRRNLDGRRDKVLDELGRRYNQAAKAFRAARGLSPHRPTSLNQSYLLTRLLRGYPWKKAAPVVPRLTFDDYAHDSRFAASVKSLDEGAVPYELVHLPVQAEVEAGSLLANPNQASLLASLERITHRRVVRLHERLRGRTVPPILDLRPHDAHPNRGALELYADLIAEVVLDGFVDRPGDKRRFSRDVTPVRP